MITPQQYGRIFGEVMQENPKADALLVNKILRKVVDQIEGFIPSPLGPQEFHAGRNEDPQDLARF